MGAQGEALRAPLRLLLHQCPGLRHSPLLGSCRCQCRQQHPRSLQESCARAGSPQSPARGHAAQAGRELLWERNHCMWSWGLQGSGTCLGCPADVGVHGCIPYTSPPDPAGLCQGGGPAVLSPLCPSGHLWAGWACGGEQDGELQGLYCLWKYILGFHNGLCGLRNASEVFGEDRISPEPTWGWPASPRARPCSLLPASSGNDTAWMNNLAVTQLCVDSHTHPEH